MVGTWIWCNMGHMDAVGYGVYGYSGDMERIDVVEYEVHECDGIQEIRIWWDMDYMDMVE